MDSFCDDLRLERERHNISIEWIGQNSKVPSRYLRSLEAGEYGDLPKGVFRKGIVREYLAAVGLDETSWMLRFEAALKESGEPLDGDGDLAEFVENVSRSRPSEPASAPGVRWLGLIMMTIAVALLGWCVWRYVLLGHVIVSNVRPER